MNVLEIKRRVKRGVGDESGGQITDADIIDWINDAQAEICRLNDVIQVIGTLPTVIGTGLYALTGLADILKLRMVKYDGMTLKGLSQQEADEFISTYDQGLGTGTPTHFWIFANKITLFPVPSAVKNLNIYYIRKPLAVAIDADIPELPIQYHKQIVDYCIAHAKQQDDDMSAYAIKMQEFAGNVRDSRIDEDWTTQEYYPSISISRDDAGPWQGDVYG
jgi:hypothetical protein